MTGRYSYALDEAALDVFSASTKRERDQLVKVFRTLAESPMEAGDFAETGASGRRVEVQRLGKWLISYWPDHAVKELRVVDITRLTSR